MLYQLSYTRVFVVERHGSRIRLSNVAVPTLDPIPSTLDQWWG